MSEGHRMRALVAAAGVAVLAQEAMTTYPDSQSGSRTFWGLVSLALLALVYRRSNVARTLFAVLAAMGFILFTAAAIDDLTFTSISLAILYAVEAGTMLSDPARTWTHTKPRRRMTAPREARANSPQV